MDDVRAVMDAAGSERAVLFGISEGGPMSVLFAATYPERTSALVLYGAMGRTPRRPTIPGPRPRSVASPPPSSSPPLGQGAEGMLELFAPSFASDRVAAVFTPL